MTRDGRPGTNKPIKNKMGWGGVKGGGEGRERNVPKKQLVNRFPTWKRHFPAPYRPLYAGGRSNWLGVSPWASVQLICIFFGVAVGSQVAARRHCSTSRRAPGASRWSRPHLVAPIGRQADHGAAENAPIVPVRGKLLSSVKPCRRRPLKLSNKIRQSRLIPFLSF